MHPIEKTILIVDDSASVRELVSFTLETAGYKVLQGRDGEDALKYLEDTEIQLIITDLHMPKMDGIDLISRIRRIDKYKSVPILLLTTESHYTKKQDAEAAGATGWIIKPFDQARLLEVVQKVIN